MTHEESKPNGILVAIGGNEDKERDRRVLREIADLPERGARVVEVVPTASSVPDETARTYVEAFGAVGVEEVRVMDIRSRADAANPDCVKRIDEADVVFFTGGDQVRITSLIGGTPVAHAVRARYWDGAVIAGTSAGAAAMSETMIFEGETETALRKGNVRMAPGLGLLPTAILDTHFIHRGRLGRLLEVISANPGLLGIGLGEDTGLVVRQGHRAEVIGHDVVVVVDGAEISYTNVSEARSGDPLAVERLVVHTLVHGHGYDLAAHRYLRPDEERRP